MEYFLDLADDYFFDRAYASVLPAASFLPAALQQFNQSDASPASSSSLASTLLHFLPHPPLPSIPFDVATTSAWPRDYMLRQFVSFYIMVFIGIHLMYFAMGGFSYYFIFNHDMKKHPRYLPNQVWKEIKFSLQAFPWLVGMTVPWFVYEVRGGGMFYDKISDYGWAYAIASVPLFLVFTDVGIYWVHRLEHHPLIYKHVHKPHHKWIIPTPFASHAFHPIDGYAQSLPYHLFPMIFPLHKKIYIGLFTFVNAWSIFIHDSDMIADSWLYMFFLSPAHHTLHHLFFTVNYGQYFAFSDRMGGSLKEPAAEYDPMNAVHQIIQKESAQKAALKKVD